MDHHRSYFLGSGKQVGFNPLQVIGLSAIQTNLMQSEFAEIPISSQEIDSTFSIFDFRNNSPELGNMKHIFRQSDCVLPTANCFSKLVGGFIGSKSLIGFAANREQPFWNTVFQQYNCLVSNKPKSPMKIEKTAMSTNKGFISSTALDAALLISQGFDFLSCHDLCGPKRTEQVKNLETLSTGNCAPSLVDKNCSPTSDSVSGTVYSKQSYADVTKAFAAKKMSSNQTSSKELHRKNTRAHRKSRNMSSYSRDIDGRISEEKMCQNNHNWRDRSIEIGDANNSVPQNTKTMYPKRHHQIKPAHYQKQINNHERPEYNFNCESSASGMSPQKNELRYTPNAKRRSSTQKRRKSDLLAVIKEEKNIRDQEMTVTSTVDLKQASKWCNNATNNNNIIAASGKQSYHCKNWRCRPEKKFFCEACEMYNHRTVTASPAKQLDSGCPTALSVGANEDIFIDSQLPSPVLLDTDGSGQSLGNSVANIDNSSAKESIPNNTCMRRRRLSSDCSVDSEDSFVIEFDAGTNSTDELSSSDTLDYSDDEGSDEDEDCSINSKDSSLSEIESEDEVDFTCTSVPVDGDWNCTAGVSGNVLKLLDFSCISVPLNNVCSTKDAESKEIKITVDSPCLLVPSDSDSINREDIAVKLRKANADWQNGYGGLSCTEKEPEKVHFAQPSKLLKIHPMVAWSFAYRAARRGNWEECVRDRDRFRNHIKRLEVILAPVLAEEHRIHVWQRMQSQVASADRN